MNNFKQLFIDFVNQQTTNTEINHEFLDRFIYNYEHRTEQVSSDYVYGWFKSIGYKLGYSMFCNRFITNLPESCYEKIPMQIGMPKRNGGNNKLTYNITQIGLKKIIMHIDSNIIDYYLWCESLLTDFLQTIITNQQSQIVEREVQIAERDKTITQKDVIINKCKKHCFIYRIDIYSLDQLTIQFRYIGSTNNYMRRCAKHKYASSNPNVKQYIKENRKYTFTKIAEFDYLYDTDRNQIEQNYIDAIAKEECLNIMQVKVQIAQPNRQSLIINTTTQSIDDNEEEKTCIRTDDNEEEKVQITEQSFVVNIRNNYEFSQSVQLLKQFLSTNNAYPNKRSDNASEKYLGSFVMTTRSQHNNPKSTTQLSSSNKEYLLQQIPTFVFDSKELQFETQIADLAEFIAESESYPSRTRTSASSREKQLGKFVQHLRSSYNKTDISIDLNEERLKIIDQLIPNFMWSAGNPLTVFSDKVTKLQQYIQTNGYPRLSGNNRQLEEKTFGSFVNSIRIMKKTKETPEVTEKLELLLTIIPDFTWSR